MCMCTGCGDGVTPRAAFCPFTRKELGKTEEVVLCKPFHYVKDKTLSEKGQNTQIVGNGTTNLSRIRFFRNGLPGTSLVAQWLRIHLPTQGTRVQFLVQEDPTCHRATKPMCHNY